MPEAACATAISGTLLNQDVSQATSEDRKDGGEETSATVSALTISIPGVSSTTSLRRVSELTSRGYIERVPDARDGRRDFVRLTAKSRELLVDYLAHADSCLVEIRTAGEARPPSSGRSR